MDYKKIYKAANYYEAHFIKGLLKKNSIKSKLIGENLSIAVGELPPEVLQVDILVHKNYLMKAQQIMTDYENNLSSINNKEDWKCPSCNNINPASFEICWHCN